MSLISRVRAVAVVTVVALIGGTAGAAPAVADLPEDPGDWVVEPAGPDAERAAAQTRAAATGQRVEVLGARSESGQVFANPDGSFTSETSMVPARVRRDGGWVPVDATLERRADGTVAPKAVPLTLAFSGGGTAPLVRLGRDGKELALTWPTALPAPRLAGDTATYPDVLPGVDLRMQATAVGYSEVLVVKTREAAANPALTAIRLGLATTGLTVTADAAGNLSARDAAGTLVFGAPAPLMWDSAPPADAATNGMPGPGRPGEHQAVIEVEVGPGRLELQPDKALLTDPATQYPVYIDPGFTEGAAGWTLVLEGVTQPKWNGANDTSPIVGKSGWSDWDGPAVKYRTYFQFNTGQVLGTVLKSAQFRVMEVWAPSCTPTWVDAYGTAPIHPGTNWANQPSQQWAVGIGGHNAAFGRPGCESRFLEWNAAGAVAESMRRGLGTTTIMLQARNEGDRFAWKKWLVNADSPHLSVTYNRLPDVPYNLSVEHKPCATTPNQPYVNPLNPSDQPLGPTLRAQVSDPDGGLVGATFEWSLLDGTRAGSAATAGANSTSFFGAQIPSATFRDGDTFRYRVLSRDTMDNGFWTGFCHATIDRTKPPAPQAVRSGTYPEDDIGGAAGFTGGFTFTAPPGSDVAGFLYGLHDQPTQFVRTNQPGGTANAMVTPPDNGPHTLYVYSVDRANNVSNTRYEYHFVAGRGTPPVAHWRLDGLTDTQVLDSRPRRHDGTITSGPARWVNGRQGDALFLDGSSGHVNTTGGRAVRTDTSFSVAAWVRLEQAGTANLAAVSQDGGTASAFTLQYTPDVRKWAFTMAQADAANADSDRVVSDATVQTGVWTHLVGTYEPSTGDMRLYVNGVLQAGIGKHTNRWTHATGSVQLGRGKFNGGPVGYWPGALDDVQLYDRVISAREAHDLASAPVEEVFLALDEAAGVTATDESGHFRSVHLGAGASWTTRVDDLFQLQSPAMQLDGTAAGVATNTRWVVRTDQSFMVSARLRLDAAAATGTGTITAVSQDGPLSSGFTLGYNRATKGWTFALSPADAASPSRITVDSSALGRPATPGQWTHLLGIYDAAAGTVKLFVDGEPTESRNGRSTTPVLGGLALGRDKRNGQAGGFWRGAIDDVHVWRGASEAEGLSAFFSPVSGRPSAFDGQLNRYLTIDQTSSDHITVPGGAASFYHFEGSLGAFAPAGAANTRMLYLCRLGVDEFTSPEPDCEGQEVLGPLGPVYQEPPADQPVIGVYRCLVRHPTYIDHFDSTDPECEGQTKEFRLGYTRPYMHLVRYTSPTYPYDHTSSTTRVAADYIPEGSLGRLAMHSGEGRVALWSCLDGADSFLSTDQACEGKTLVRRLGWIWTAPPGDLASRELFRCRASWGDLFESTHRACEGQTVVTSLGFVAAGL
jgi:hypothetical protein